MSEKPDSKGEALEALRGIQSVATLILQRFDGVQASLGRIEKALEAPGARGESGSFGAGSRPAHAVNGPPARALGGEPTGCSPIKPKQAEEAAEGRAEMARRQKLRTMFDALEPAHQEAIRREAREIALARAPKAGGQFSDVFFASEVERTVLELVAQRHAEAST